MKIFIFGLLAFLVTKAYAQLRACPALQGGVDTFSGMFQLEAVVPGGTNPTRLVANTVQTQLKVSWMLLSVGETSSSRPAIFRLEYGHLTPIDPTMPVPNPRNSGSLPVAHGDSPVFVQQQYAFSAPLYCFDPEGSLALMSETVLFSLCTNHTSPVGGSRRDLVFDAKENTGTRLTDCESVLVRVVET